MKRIYISGNYVIVDNNGVIGEYPTSRSVYTKTENGYMIKEQIDNGQFEITTADIRNWFDESGTVAFSESTLVEFLQNNTANFSTLTGGSVSEDGYFVKWDDATKKYVLSPVSSQNIGTDNLTINQTGDRRLILGGSLSTDGFSVRKSNNAQDFFKVRGDGEILGGLNDGNNLLGFQINRETSYGSQFLLKGYNGENFYFRVQGRKSSTNQNVKQSGNLIQFGFFDGNDSSAPKMNFILRKLTTFGVYNGFSWYMPSSNTANVTDADRLMWLTANGTLGMFNGAGSTEYSKKPNSFEMYASDKGVDNSAPHFRTEAGDVIILYSQDNTVANPEPVFNLGTTINENTTFNGFTIGQMAQALFNNGILK